jgi:hypothetical protein
VRGWDACDTVACGAFVDGESVVSDGRGRSVLAGGVMMATLLQALRVIRRIKIETLVRGFISGSVSIKDALRAHQRIATWTEKAK